LLPLNLLIRVSSVQTFLVAFLEDAASIHLHTSLAEFMLDTFCNRKKKIT
jgi:uncharacterized protein (DUF1778 family)